jgi:arginyl-tRNA synthetase
MLISDLIKAEIQKALLQFPELASNEELVSLEPSKNKQLADLASTVALVLAKPLRKAPLQIANTLKESISPFLQDLTQVEVAPPGFLNFKLKPLAFARLLQNLNTSQLINQNTAQPSLLIEFVSANPTGDLHLGHGRGAVVGSALASIYRATGRSVKTEFYINDAGEQIQKLGRSAWKLCTGQAQGEGDEYPAELIQPYVSDLIEKGSNGLSFEELTDLVKGRILEKQKEVLGKLHVHFDRWVSEKTDIHDSGALDELLKRLKSLNLTYEQEGALWLKSSQLGDERDRVLLKSGGRRPTYLTGDLAYHLNKMSRSEQILDIFGADHKGQELSLKVALQACGQDINNFHLLFIQFVSIIENGEEVKMSKRTGSVIGVEEVLDKVGADAFRFMLLQSHINNRLAFDIDLAKRQDDQNPVFYVQYSHARACSILRKAVSEQPDGSSAFCSEQELLAAYQDQQLLNALLGPKLTEKEITFTKELILKLAAFNREVWSAANNMNPSGLVHYLIELATAFHAFYAPCRVINFDEKTLSLARLALVRAFARIVKEALQILAVSAPERM